MREDVEKVDLYLSLGSNQGDREYNIETALSLLNIELKTPYKAVSALYETEPWGFESDDRFLNVAVLYELRLQKGFNPEAEGLMILETCKSIERRLGRTGVPHHCIFIEVIQDETIDAIARQRPLAPDRDERAAVVDNLHLIGRTDVALWLGALFDGGRGKALGIFARVEDALYTPVELRSQQPRIGGNGDATIGIEAQQISRQEGRSSDRFAVLRWHGHHQTTNLATRKGLQHAIIDAMEALQFEKGIDLLGKIEKGHRKDRKSGKSGKSGGKCPQ